MCVAVMLVMVMRDSNESQYCIECMQEPLLSSCPQNCCQMVKFLFGDTTLKAFSSDIF